MILMHPGLGKPLTRAASDARQFAPAMIFDFRGFVPVDFVFVGGSIAESVSFSSSYATFNHISYNYSISNEKFLVVLQGPESAFCRACTSYELQHICIKVLLFGQHFTDHIVETVSTPIRDVVSKCGTNNIIYVLNTFVIRFLTSVLKH